MAQRRMLSKKITDTDRFLDLSTAAQALYFHLNMHADDEGFVSNPKTVIRTVGANDDDFNLLILKQYLLPFDSGIVVITDWKIHNYIQKDRFQPTFYKAEKAELSTVNGVYTKCIQNVSEMDTQVRLGKDRLGKDVVSRPVKTETEKYEPQKPEPKTIDAVEVEPTRKSFELWEQLWGFPNAIAVQEIDNWINTIGDDMLLFAVNYAGSRTVKASGAVRYISKIVEGWRQKNIATVEQAEKANQEHEQRMSTERGGWSNQPKQKETLPDWAKDDYEPEKKETTPEKLAAIQAQMARLQASKDDD